MARASKIQPMALSKGVKGTPNESSSPSVSGLYPSDVVNCAPYASWTVTLLYDVPSGSSRATSDPNARSR